MYMSRTRRSMQMVRRRAGTVTGEGIRDDPGSARHRFALLALHHIRDATHCAFAIAG